uniref:Uncharacterized protein n=1 Tax=viral metagenome TaxID=1070528 RepID=A0A6C0II26_9ZZZZ
MDSDATLIQLLQSVPFEIREKIQRFTYNTQNKPLLKEIADFASAKRYFNELTTLVDTTNSGNGFYETTENIHAQLWPGLDYIRHNPFKKQLLKTWKYKTEFICAERGHADGEIIFRRLDWDTSFAVNFWMCIYH